MVFRFLSVTKGTSLLVLGFIQLFPFAPNVLGGLGNICGPCCATSGAGLFLLAHFVTSGFLHHFISAPAMALRIFIAAFGAGALVIITAVTAPTAVTVTTAALAAIYRLGFAGIVLIAAGSAGFICLMGMGRFICNASIAMIVGRCTAIAIIRDTENMIFNFSFFSVNTVDIAAVPGVAFYCNRNAPGGIHRHN